MNGGGTVNFDVKFKRRQGEEGAGAFAFKQVPEKCDEETIPVNTTHGQLREGQAPEVSTTASVASRPPEGQDHTPRSKEHGVFLDGPNDIGDDHNCGTGAGAQAREIGWKVAR